MTIPRCFQLGLLELLKVRICMPVLRFFLGHTKRKRKSLCVCKESENHVFFSSLPLMRTLSSFFEGVTMPTALCKSNVVKLLQYVCVYWYYSTGSVAHVATLKRLWFRGSGGAFSCILASFLFYLQCWWWESSWGEGKETCRVGCISGVSSDLMAF